MDRALKELGGTCWVAGLRRDQTESRSNFLLLKIVMTSSNYIQLLIGITKKLSEVDNPREACLGGFGRECGLHLDCPYVIDLNI